jgi:predicted lactoylglutathione lyase
VLQTIAFEIENILLNIEFNIQSVLAKIQQATGQDSSGTISRLEDIRIRQAQIENTRTLEAELQKQLRESTADLTIEIPIVSAFDYQGNKIIENVSLQRVLGTENIESVLDTSGLSSRVLQNYANELFSDNLSVGDIPALRNIQNILGTAFTVPEDSQNLYAKIVDNVHVLTLAQSQYNIVLSDTIAELTQAEEAIGIWQRLGNAVSTVVSSTSHIGSGARLNIEARAKGGAVTEGSPYLVGERGVELFVPKTSGTIIPNDKISGGKQTINNVTIHAVTDVNYLLRELNRRGVKL